MADDFRRYLDRKTGKGGVKCTCCNRFFGKDRKKLHQQVRRILKRKLGQIKWQI